MEKKAKEKRGITLIVLIITVILMLILAGVAVSTITTDGIPFGKMENIAGKYNNTVEERQNAIDKIISEMNEDYIGEGSEGEGSGGNTTPPTGGDDNNKPNGSYDENAKINSIDNIEFMVGDVENALSELIKQENVLPDVVFVDPPRKGLDNKTIDNLLKTKPEKIVYISCNPSTLMRDLSKLEQDYSVNKIAPVDLFPWTSHVECVAVLQLKQDM